MKIKQGIIYICTGSALLALSLILLLYNCKADRYAGDEAGKTVNEIIGSIEASDDTANAENSGMKVVDIDGYGYIGYLSIPEFGLELPIMSEWDGNYKRLRIAPCRQFGAADTDDLVIAGHNYSTHFGKLKNLKAGDKLSFTDMDGMKISYQVESVTTIDPDQVDLVENSNYDLVLYTCTYGGRSRVAVCCNRADS